MRRRRGRIWTWRWKRLVEKTSAFSDRRRRGRRTGCNANVIVVLHTAPCKVTNPPGWEMLDATALFLRHEYHRAEPATGTPEHR